MAPTKKQRACLLGLIIIYNEYQNHLSRQRKSKKTRTVWVNSFLQLRDNFCIENKLVTDLLAVGEEKCSNFLRLNYETFMELHGMVEEKIKRQNTRLRDAISTKVKLAILLRYLATGDSQISLEYLSRVSRTTISKMIPLLCAAIYMVLKDTYLNVPKTEGEWREISNDFNNRWNFPHTLGALDGKHIAVVAPAKQGSYYFNYKGYHSIVLLALVDARYRFIYIDVGCNGRISDGGIYKNSSLYKGIIEKTLNLPLIEPIEGCQKPIPYFVIADEAFSLSDTLMKPYSKFKKLTAAQRVFNYRLSRARRVVENAFGIMTAKFRILRRTLETSITTTESIVKCCCVLHNFLCFKRQHLYFNNTETDGLQQNALDQIQRQGGNFSSESARDIREALANYFLNEGAIDMQWKNI